MKQLVLLVLVIAWLAGAVLAAGGMKFVAFIFPFYSWYLVVELAMKHFGLV